MAVHEVTMYRVLCDRCGASAQDDSEYYAWADTDQAISDAESADWLVNDAGQWCPSCVIYDEEQDEHLPNPEPVAGAVRAVIGRKVRTNG